jgi:hypothetical protein
MTQITVEEISKSKLGNVLHLEVLVNGRRLVRDITASKVDTVQKLALWLVSQPLDISEVQPRRQAVIDYHIDPGLGPVIDNLNITLLAEDQAIADIEALPGWATFSGDEAENWIEVNVTSLATAKTALKAMARLLVAERNAIKKLVERIGK